MLSFCIAFWLFHAVFQSQCDSYSLSEFFLIESPSMPYHGSEWATYSNDTTNEIWLLSPIQGQPKCCSKPPYVLSYNINTNTFSTETPVQEEFSCLGSHCSVAVGTTIYFNNKKYEFGSYNIRTEQYIAPITPTLPMAVKNACLTSDGRYVYVIGGEDASSYRNYFQIYDIQQNNWLNNITPDTLTTSRVAAACQVHKGTVYIFGGKNANDISSIESIYVGFGDDVITNLTVTKWKTLSASLSIGRYGISSTICNNIDENYVYLIGGYDLGGLKYSIGNIVEVFDMDNNTLITLPFGLNQERFAPAVNCVNQYIYVMGGQWTNGTHIITGDNWEISNALYTMAPTYNPSQSPSLNPTASPSINPSQSPSVDPSRIPSKTPTISPVYIATTGIMTTLQTQTQTSGETKTTINTFNSQQSMTAEDDGAVVDETSTISPDKGNSVDHKRNNIERDNMMIYVIVGAGIIFICGISIFIGYYKKKNKQQAQNNMEYHLKSNSASPRTPTITATTTTLEIGGTVNDASKINVNTDESQYFQNNLVNLCGVNNVLMNDIVNDMDPNNKYTTPIGENDANIPPATLINGHDNDIELVNVATPSGNVENNIDADNIDQINNINGEMIISEGNGNNVTLGQDDINDVNNPNISNDEFIICCDSNTKGLE